MDMSVTKKADILLRLQREWNRSKNSENKESHLAQQEVDTSESM